MNGDALNLLLVDDSEDDSLLILLALKRAGYEVDHTRVDTLAGFESALDRGGWDAIISDFTMPEFSGMGALEAFKKREIDIPFFFVSGSVDEARIVEAVKAGAQDYIMKDNLMRLGLAMRRELADAKDRRGQKERETQLQRTEEKLDRLKRFFSPQIAELAASETKGDPFQWHRKDVTVIFVDLHGFTNFVEVSEPEEVLEILQEYYSEVGRAVQKYQGTVGHVAGDGIMIFLNDPITIEDAPAKGVIMALEIRDMMTKLTAKWDQLEYPLGYGAGVASGFATIGGVGVDGCWDYSIFGTVTNTASRLCSHAKDGQILVSKRFITPLADKFEFEPVGELALKGLSRSVVTYNVLGKK